MPHLVVGGHIYRHLYVNAKLLWDIYIYIYIYIYMYIYICVCHIMRNKIRGDATLKLGC